LQELSQEHGLPAKLGWTSGRGFFITLPLDKNSQFDRRRLPNNFLSVQVTKTAVSFITQEFVIKDKLVRNTMEEISVMSNAVLEELLAEVREHIGFLYQLSETLALLDLLRSLATVSMARGFVKENSSWIAQIKCLYV